MKKQHLKALLLFNDLVFADINTSFDNCINALIDKADKVNISLEEYLDYVLKHKKLPEED